MFQAIHLNHWHSLRKRLRHVQKEKMTLREEIMRIKAEREQVALRMDAIRIKHEADTRESKVRIVKVLCKANMYANKNTCNSIVLMHPLLCMM